MAGTPALVAPSAHCGKAQGFYELARKMGFRTFSHENRNIDSEGKRDPCPSRESMRALHLGLEKDSEALM